MKNKFSMWVLPFLIGVLIGGALVWLCYCCCCKMQCSRQDKTVQMDSLLVAPQLIDTITANNYFKTYMLSPVGVDTLKAFTINLQQYNAMGLILKAIPSAHGFRIYMGAQGTPTNRILMVVGTGSPDKTGTIYATSATGTGPCPIVCDNTSPILKP